MAVGLCAPISSHSAGLLSPSDSSLPALQIKSHDVTVIVQDGYAITTIEQVFHNPHNQDLEAIYSFPVPNKAAVNAFTYWIDGKPVTGEVLEKKAKRDLYEDQKAQGKEAAITEQDSHKTFDISVTPVKAMGDVRIESIGAPSVVAAPDDDMAIKYAEATEGFQRVVSQTKTLGSAQNAYALDKDIVMYWRHTADLPESVDLVT